MTHEPGTASDLAQEAIRVMDTRPRRAISLLEEAVFRAELLEGDEPSGRCYRLALHHLRQRVKGTLLEPEPILTSAQRRDWLRSAWLS